MKLTEFDIDFIKFKNETDQTHYKLENTFFGLKENSLYTSCDIDVKVVCRRNEDNIKLNYQLKGYVFSQCERCLKDIKLSIDAAEEEVLKLTSNDALLKEESYISINHQVYNIYDSLYEYICLNMPTRKICELSESKEECNIEHQTPDVDEDIVDERWAELRKLIK